MQTLTSQELAGIYQQCLHLFGNRQVKWRDAFQSMPKILALIDESRDRVSASVWCADMALLKLKRFYEAKDEDSLLDCINYLGMAVWCLRKEPDPYNTRSK